MSQTYSVYQRLTTQEDTLAEQIETCHSASCALYQIIHSDGDRLHLYAMKEILAAIQAVQVKYQNEMLRITLYLMQMDRLMQPIKPQNIFLYVWIKL